MSETQLIGEPIAGSRYLRDYCDDCGTAMRVKRCYDSKKRRRPCYCVECGETLMHIGCSGPPSPIDADAFAVSTQSDPACLV